MERSHVVSQQDNSFSLLGLAIILVLIANVIFAVAGDPREEAYQVLVEGQEIGLVAEGPEIERFVNQLTEESKSLGADVVIPKVEIVKTKAEVDLIKDISGVKNQLAHMLKAELEGFALKVNGQIEVVLRSEAEASKSIEQLKLALAGKHSDWLSQAGFEETIEIIPVRVAPEKVIPVEEAVEYLKTGGVKAKIHKVQNGENLWTIARANDMRVAEILKANPGLDEEKIQIDQELKLVQSQPVLNLVATFEKTVIEPMAFDVKRTKDRALPRGQKKVITPGKKGEKEVTYQVVVKNGETVKKEVLEAKVLKKPTPEIVAEGTKVRATMIASRGDGGSGNLLWPAKGAITSGYGKRWGRMHTGIDIDGSTGDAVRAAADGKVIHADWYYEYGKTIIIDHGNGFTTLYAHLNSYSVGVGDRVDAGTKIGAVGNTGRSTGSHLHFETRVNGAHKNPISYLR